MKAKKTAKIWLCIALALCLISILVTSCIQTDMGKVHVSELRLVDEAGYEVSVQLCRPKTATKENLFRQSHNDRGWYNNKEMQDLYSVELARRGYVVVIATDMHGHGDSEATTSEELFTAGVGTDAAVRLAATLPYVDSSKMGMTAHSSGASAGIDMEIQLDNTEENSILSRRLCFRGLAVGRRAGNNIIDQFGDDRSIGLIQSSMMSSITMPTTMATRYILRSS